MRITSTNTAALFATAAVTLVAGCSGGSSPSALPAGGNFPAGASSVSRNAQSIGHAKNGDRSGVAPKFLQHINFGMPRLALPPPTNSPYKELAVSDFGTAAVEILGQAFLNKSTIKSGLTAPDGDWLDASKNLYVADYAAVDVQEYAGGSTTPTFTYSAGLSDPIDVTTDTKGNVYVTDFLADLVVEYAQGQNTVLHECTLGGGVEGVAVDPAGNVFASFNNAQTGIGNLVEFKGGLGSCTPTVLAPTVGFAGGLQLANDGSLLAADQNLGVDIIPKPYTAIASTITGALDSFHIALTKYNKLLFIADPGSADVLVVKYPSGTPYLTLGAASGLVDPAGVAVYEVGTN